MWDVLLGEMPHILTLLPEGERVRTTGKRTNCNRKTNWRRRNTIARASRKRNR